MVTTLSDTVRGISMINQYGRLDPVLDLGSFDSVVEGSDSVLRFFPTKFRLNNYNVITMSYSMDQIGDVVSSIGSTTICLLYTSPSPRDATLSRMPSSA